MNESMATEETEWTEAGGNVYALTKKGAEMEVWRGSQEGLKVVIVNPGIIIGPTDWHQGSGKLFATANQGYSYYPPGGTGFVSINDVVRMMIQLMKSSITNERYIAVAENLSYQEILSAIAKALGKNPPKKRLRIWQLKTFRFVDWAWCAISGNKRSMTKSTVRSLMNRQIFDNQKIKTDLNFEFDNISESIEFTANCFLADHS